MTRRTLTLGLMTLAAVAAGLFFLYGPQSGGVYGPWRRKAPIRDEGLRQMYLSMEIRADAVTFRYDCHFLDGATLAGSFTTRAEVSGTAIAILEAGVARASSDDHQCIASIQPTTLTYRLTGGELAVTFKNTVVTLVRAGPG